MKTWNPYFKTLDYYRGFAALWVMVFHGLAAYYQLPFHPVVKALQAFAQYGHYGVNIFFIISGYCIAASSQKLLSKNGSTLDFLKNRLWRVFPIYWAALVLAIVMNLLAMPFNGTSFSDNFPLSPKYWLGHIFLAQPYLEVDNYVGVYWSLTVEVAFYFTVAILLAVSKKTSQKIALFIGLTLGIISVFVNPGIHITFLSFWSEFVCGFLLFTALWAKHNNKKLYHNLSIFIILTLGCLGVWVDLSFHTSKLWFSAIFAICLYFLYDFDKQIDSTPQIQWLKQAGIISYALYLIHVPFQAKIINLGLKFIPSDSLMILPLQMFGWAVAITASYFFYRLVEKPINNWRYQRKSTN
jgi:peptidoglycan/LPS O-acetylase OafA/YrhL